jgi:hypothetical protein
VKVKGGVTQTQVVEGTISLTELLALVRETVHIPEHASARFYAQSAVEWGQCQLPQQKTVDVSADHPLRFRITWESPLARKQG